MTKDTCIFYAGNDKCLYTFEFGGCKYRKAPNKCTCKGKPKDLATYKMPEELRTISLQKLGGVL